MFTYRIQGSGKLVKILAFMFNRFRWTINRIGEKVTSTTLYSSSSAQLTHPETTPCHKSGLARMQAKITNAKTIISSCAYVAIAGAVSKSLVLGCLLSSWARPPTRREEIRQHEKLRLYLLRLVATFRLPN